MWRRYLTAVMAAGLVFLLAGCAESVNLDDVSESTLTVHDDGGVEQVLIESFEEPDYSAEELQEDIEGWISDYTGEGEQTVTLDSLSVDGDAAIATVRLSYQTAEDYRAFNGVDFFAGTVQEAIEAGYSFPTVFLDKNGEQVAFDTVRSACQDEKVIFYQEPMNVMTTGAILYVSDNMEIVDSNTASLENDTVISYESGQAVTDHYGIVIYDG